MAPIASARAYVPGRPDPPRRMPRHPDRTMSTLVLARKYRPRNFAEMVGQEHVVQALSNALTQQRLHHAYLFTGTRGVGKTTVSRVLAKSLNCTGADGRGGITAQPCGVCPACRDIDAGRFVDYVELDAASNRGVDEITALLDQSVYKPVLGRFKVYMIDEVHMMTSHAFNAMLKTLEEPPDYLKFVLATTDPQKVPVTVLSRCLQFNLRPMAPETIQQHLQTVLAAEAIAADAGALRLIARNARGSMRDALSLADQAIAFGAGELVEAGVRQMLGAVDRSHVQRIVQSLAASDGAGLVAVVDGLRRLGLSGAGTLEELAAVTQQMALIQALPQAGDDSDPDTPMLRELAASLASDETQLLYSIALHGRAELALAPDEYSGLTMVLLRALAFRPPGAAVQARPAPSTSVAGSVAGAAAAARPMVPRSRELLRTPATAALAVADLPLPPPVARAAQPDQLVAQRSASAAPAAEPSLAAASAPALTLSAPAPAPAPAAAAAAAAAAPIARVEPATRHNQDVLEEPEWLRADDPQDDRRVNGAAHGQHLPAREPPPPWDDDLPDPPRGQRPSPAPAATAPAVAPAAVRVVRAPAPVDAAQVALEAAPRIAPAHVEQPVTSQWLTLLQPVFAAARLNGFVRELAWQAECLVCERAPAPGASAAALGGAAVDQTKVDSLQVTLRVARESLRQPLVRERLQAALTEQLGCAVSIEVVAGAVTDSAALRDAAARGKRQADAEVLVHNHPLVKSLLAALPGARILPGSIRPTGTPS